MARLSHHADKVTADHAKYGDQTVENFMGGNSYTLSPLDTLKIIAASSIFAEPQYYRDGEGSKKKIDDFWSSEKEDASCYSIFADLFKETKSATEIFTLAIDSALDADFKGTLDLALELRTVYMMRLNPSVIWMRASIHSKRAEFNQKNPCYMKEIGKKISIRPDDVTNQFEYYAFVNGSKQGLSSLVKRTWAETLEGFSRYQLNKYKGKRLIDLVRISHANSEDITELMQTGTIKVEEHEQTWENYISKHGSNKESWEWVIDNIWLIEK